MYKIPGQVALTIKVNGAYKFHLIFWNFLLLYLLQYLRRNILKMTCTFQQKNEYQVSRFINGMF